MRAVNLLPLDAYAPRQRLPHAPVMLAATVPLLAAALVYVGYSLEHAQVADRQLSLGLVQSQIAALSPSQALVAESGQVGDERTRRETALADALVKQVPWDVTFDQLSRVLPARAWLTSLSAQSPTPATSIAGAAASSPTSVTIQGETYTQADVATVLSRLALVPALADVALASTTSNDIGKKPVVQFSITASLRSSGS
jgi:Tfp pilus assembly protein PilN